MIQVLEKVVQFKNGTIVQAMGVCIGPKWHSNLTDSIDLCQASSKHISG